MASVQISRQAIKDYIQETVEKARQATLSKDFRSVLSESISEKDDPIKFGIAVNRMKKIFERKTILEYFQSIIDGPKGKSARVRLAVLHEVMKLHEAKASTAPHYSTGINILETLLKKIIPIMEKDYKMLTTDRRQRDSFRAHILSAIENILAGPRMADEVDDEEGRGVDVSKPIDGEPDIDYIEDPEFGKISEDLSVEVDEDDDGTHPPEPGDNQSDDEKRSKLIDIDTARKPFGQAKAQAAKDIEFSLFSLDGQEETGRNVAYDTFKKLQTNIIDSYEMLANPEDRKLFYDYLITNLKLYFDRFEEDLKMNHEEEPTTDEYETQKDDVMDDYVDQGGEEGENEPEEFPPGPEGDLPPMPPEEMPPV